MKVTRNAVATMQQAMRTIYDSPELNEIANNNSAMLSAISDISDALDVMAEQLNFCEEG